MTFLLFSTSDREGLCTFSGFVTSVILGGPSKMALSLLKGVLLTEKVPTFATVTLLPRNLACTWRLDIFSSVALPDDALIKRLIQKI